MRYGNRYSHAAMQAHSYMTIGQLQLMNTYIKLYGIQDCTHFPKLAEVQVSTALIT